MSETTDFGAVWLGLVLWRTLGLDGLFGGLMPPGREEIAWDLLTAVLVLARFCEPSSERHIAETWYPQTALPELLGIAAEQVHVQRLYRVLDVVVVHKEAVERHLTARLRR